MAAVSSRQGHRYEKGDHVEVKHKGFGKGPLWVAATVHKVDGGRGHGLFATAKGKTDFYSWNQVRPVKAEDKPVSLRAPLTAVAGVADLRDFVKVETLAGSPGGDKENTDPSLIGKLGTEPELSSATEEAVPLTNGSRMRKPHRVTRVGEIFRRCRLAKNHSQEVAGRAIGCSNSHFSKLELGGALPSDEQLLRFSEVYGYDLAALEDARRKDERTLHLSSALPEPKEPPLMHSPQPAPASTSPASVPFHQKVSTNVEQPADFVDFLALLKRLVPCPTDKAKRTEWMTAAEQLWELSRGA